MIEKAVVPNGGANPALSPGTGVINPPGGRDDSLLLVPEGARRHYHKPNFHVTVDVAVFRRDPKGRYDHQVLLIKRRKNSGAFPNTWALPGGFVEPDESFEAAALRELKEETGIDATIWPISSTGSMLPFNIYTVMGKLNRDPRGRIISAVFAAVQKQGENGYPEPKGGDDAQEAKWFHLSEIPRLAFDHNQIVMAGLFDFIDVEYG